MLRRNLGDTLRRKGCDDSFLRYKMLRRNPSGVLRRKVPWTLHFSAFLVQIPSTHLLTESIEPILSTSSSIKFLIDPMLQIEILLDVVGTSEYHCGALQSFPVEIIEQGNEYPWKKHYRLYTTDGVRSRGSNVWIPTELNVYPIGGSFVVRHWFTRSRWPPIMPEDPYAYIVAAYQAPPLPDYMPGPEEPQSPPPLDFVPEPIYPEYMPLEDEILWAKEQPLPDAASPTTDSPGYVPESDPEEEPEEDDEDPEEDPADYPADEDEDEDEDEEEEHPALANSVPPVHRMTVRISIRDEPSISLPPREEVNRLLTLTTPPPSLLTPLSSPLPHIASPPLPASPLASILPASPPASPIRLLGYRAAMIWLRAEAAFTSHSLPLPPL
ncbi:hypothetical protein Tco_0962301, partial [Tanacetum coccineum]